MRLKEYEKLEEFRQQLLLNLMSFLSTVKLKGITYPYCIIEHDNSHLCTTLGTVQGLYIDYNRFNVNELCTRIDQQYVVQCFPDAFPLKPFMNHFWIMTKVCNSKIFVDFWRITTFTAVKNRSAGLALGEVEKELWTPVFNQCKELLDKLKDCSLSLQVVDKLFKGQHDISGNIKQLCRGVEMCQRGQDVKDFKWIRGVTARMNQYWRLRSFADTAEAFLQIRDALKLTGDFGLVERIAAQVRHHVYTQ